MEPPSIFVSALDRDDARLAAVVDRYVDLIRRLREIRAGRDRIRAILRGVMALRGADRLEGRAWAIVLRAGEGPPRWAVRRRRPKNDGSGGGVAAASRPR